MHFAVSDRPLPLQVFVLNFCFY